MLHHSDRGKVATDLRLIECLSNDIPEEIRNLERSISEKFDRLEICHAKERMKLTKMKMGKLSALVYMYPGLTTFDPDMAKLGKINRTEEDVHYNSRSNIVSRSYYSSDEDDSVYDGPIDYKVGN